MLRRFGLMRRAKVHAIKRRKIAALQGLRRLCAGRSIAFGVRRCIAALVRGPRSTGRNKAGQKRRTAKYGDASPLWVDAADQGPCYNAAKKRRTAKYGDASPLWVDAAGEGPRHKAAKNRRTPRRLRRTA